MELILKVDAQERKKVPILKEYIEAGKGKYSINKIIIKRMPSGDYAIGNLVGIERKSEDFLDSIFSGLLEQQLIELRNYYQYPYLFVEFNSIQEIIDYFHVNPRIITGFFASCLAHFHVPYVLSKDYFFSMMFKTIEKHCDGKDQIYEKEYFPIRRKLGKKKHQKYMVSSALHGLGIGNVLAERLIKHFGSPKVVFSASKEELIQVDGIGKEKAEKIYRMLCEESR